MLILTGPVAALLALYRAIISLAGTPDADDPRTAAQRRFDTAVDLFHHGLDTLDTDNTDTDNTDDDGGDTGEGTGAGGQRPEPGQVDPTTGAIHRRKRRRRQPETHIVIDWATLLRLRDGPAHLTGHGPIGPELARLLAADTTWRALITDPGTGTLIDLGAHTYQPSVALRRWVAARDHTHRHPDGTTTWTSPLGRTHHVPPHDHRPDH